MINRFFEKPVKESLARNFLKKSKIIVDKLSENQVMGHYTFDYEDGVICVSHDEVEKISFYRIR